MKATPRTTNHYTKRNTKKPEPIKIRWKKILTLPILILVITLILFGGKFGLDQYELNKIKSTTADYTQQLLDYQKAHPNETLRRKIIVEADVLAAGYEFEAAITLLKSNTVLQSEDSIIQRITTYQNQMNALAPYTKAVPILYFHTLISDPKIAFGKTSHSPADYKQRYVTTYEFKKIIEQMLARGYVIVNFDDVYANVNGTLVRKELKLPAGKLPFILTEDEIAYSDPMPLDGFARGLILDNGEITARVLTTDGIVKSSDAELVPIIEAFIKEHPEFSYRGARGVLSATGFAGTLGFRLSNKTEIADAKAVAAALKEKGWVFSCTSYYEYEDTYSTSPSPSKINTDLTLWNTRIKPILGNTQLFVSPYGNMLTGANLLAIKNFGYNVFFTSDNTTNVTTNNGMLIVSRIGITGDSFKTNAAYFNANFFNVSEIIDPARPK